MEAVKIRFPVWSPDNQPEAEVTVGQLWSFAAAKLTCKPPKLALSCGPAAVIPIKRICA